MLENDLKSDYRDFYEICRSGWSGSLEEGQLNMDYYLGAQWTGRESAKAKRQGRKLYVINKMKRQINLLHGYEIKNRHILKIGPVEGEDDEACQQHTGVVMHGMNSGNVTGYDIMSDAFKWGSLLSGSNLFEFWKDRTGFLKYYRHGFNSFLIDPSTTMRDLNDCDGLILAQWISSGKVKLLLPKNADTIDKIEVLNTCERWDYLGEPVLANKAKKRLYERWYKRDIEYKETVQNRMSGNEIGWDDFIELHGDKNLARYLLNDIRTRDGMPVLTKYSKPTTRIKLVIFVDGEPVFNEPDPMMMDDFPFVWFNGDFAPEVKRDELKLQGFASTLRDPQKARIRRSCQIIDIMESAIQQAKLARPQYIQNLKAVYKSGQGHVIFTKDDVPDELPLDEVVHQFGAPEIPQGMFQMMEVLDKDLTESGGMNEEIFGSDDKEIPGILHRYRTGQALTGQAGVFQNFRSAKRELGRKFTRLVQLHYRPEMIHRILSQWPVRDFYKPDFNKFDCTPTEGLMTDSQQHLFYLELRYLRETFPDFAQIITPAIMVNVMPIQFKKKLMEQIELAEQQQKQQQQQMAEDQQRMNRLIEAQTAERIAAEEENRSNAQLDRIKGIAEIQEMSENVNLEKIDRLLKLADLKLKSEDLRLKRRQNRKPIKAKTKK